MKLYVFCSAAYKVTKRWYLPIKQQDVTPITKEYLNIFVYDTAILTSPKFCSATLGSVG
jgi:hypothetical protein